MRAVFVGGTPLAVMTIRILLARGHEVVLIERDKTRIDVLSEDLACGLLHGDGTRPAVLKEVNPEQTDVLYCLTHNDQTNIIASLVGKSLEFTRVVTRIENPEFEHICIELGLEDTIIPARTIGTYLADLFEGHDPLVMSTMIRDEARAFSFVVPEAEAGPVAGLELPANTRVVCIYRNDELIVPDDATRLKADDEVVLITHRENLTKLTDRWAPLRLSR